MNFSATKKAMAKVEFSQRLMGINVRMVVDAPISPELRRSVSLAFEEAIRLNMIFSDWEAEVKYRASPEALNMVMHFLCPMNS